jgi:hypothetical protein
MNTRTEPSGVDETEVNLEADIRHLLALNHKAVDQYISSITELRAKLEAEEAKLALCLYEERKLLEELESCVE